MLVKQIEDAIRFKAISTIKLYSHWPCLAAASQGLSVLDCLELILQARTIVLRQRFGADWSARVSPVMVGDDETDELAFRALRGIGRSIRVGEQDAGASAADFFLSGPDEVVQLVRWIASGAVRARRG